MYLSVLKHTGLPKSLNTELDNHMMRSTTAVTHSHFPTSYSKKKFYWHRKKFNSHDSSRKRCQSLCDCTFTRTGLPWVGTRLSRLWLTRLRQGLRHRASITLPQPSLVLICPPGRRASGSQIIKGLSTTYPSWPSVDIFRPVLEHISSWTEVTQPCLLLLIERGVTIRQSCCH